MCVDILCQDAQLSPCAVPPVLTPEVRSHSFLSDDGLVPFGSTEDSRTQETCSSEDSPVMAGSLSLVPV
jgi:hypothetical protein